MKLKLKLGAVVTAKAWYMPRRVYGRVVGWHRGRVFIRGAFGLESFQRDSVKMVGRGNAEKGKMK